MAADNVSYQKIAKGKYKFTIRKNGTRTRRTLNCKNKAQAEQIKNKILDDLLNDRFDLSEKQITSFENIVKDFLNLKKPTLQIKSYTRYKNYLNPLSNFLKSYFTPAFDDISKIQSTYIYEFFEYQKEDKNWKNKTLEGARSLYSSLFKYAMKQGFTKKNPLEGSKPFRIEQKHTIKFFTKEELSKIYNTINPFWRDHIEFLALTGLRKAEMINLTWDRVEIDKNRSHIVIASNENWKTKTGKRRVLPLSEAAVKIIEKFNGNNKTYVFTAEKGGKIHPDKPYHALKMALKKLNLEGDIHKLRHTFAAHFLMKGNTLYDLSKILGHSDIKTTEIYAHLAPDYLQKTVENLYD